jgi:hypothetical protein
MYWALTACRRALPQAEAYELIANLELALKEIEKIAALQDRAAASEGEAKEPTSAPARKVAVKAAPKPQIARAPAKRASAGAKGASASAKRASAGTKRASAAARVAR